MANEDYYAFKVPPKKLGRRNWKLRTKGRKVLNIVWHTAENTPDRKPPDSGAESIAAYFSRTRRAASAHVCVDSDSAVFYLPSRYMAWHCIGANAFSVGIEICTQASKWEWLLRDARDYALDLLWRTAQVSAGYAISLGIEVRHVTGSQAKVGTTGIFGHGEWDSKRRTDPGPDFPWETATQMTRYIVAAFGDSDVRGMPMDGVTAAELERLGAEHGWDPVFEPDHSGDRVTPRRVRKDVKAEVGAEAAKKSRKTGMSMIERTVRDNTAEVQRLRAEVRELRAEVAALRAEVEESRRRPPPPAAAPERDLGGTPLSAPEVPPPTPQRFVPSEDDQIGLRSNNPGNIRFTGDRWRGLADPPQNARGFCVFTEARFGIRAMTKLLMNYHSRHGLTTIKGMATRWAPEWDGNDPETYARKVGIWSRFGTEQPLTMDERTLMRLVPAFIRMENGSCPYADWEIAEGVGLAL
ncbi:MAG: N-acetylmuramoyl-L-alanine amidase [Gammaproteobacteria bacterium]|nr:N-acetylmuramoyl-L-alanine amidase [Gammaproteobacteria bacterium]